MPKHKITDFPLFPVFENYDVDITLTKKYGIDNQYDKFRFY